MEEEEMSCGDIPGTSSDICKEMEEKKTKTLPETVNSSHVAESMRGALGELRVERDQGPYHRGIPLSRFHSLSIEIHLTNVSKAMAIINSHRNPDKLQD